MSDILTYQGFGRPPEDIEIAEEDIESGCEFMILDNAPIGIYLNGCLLVSGADYTIEHKLIIYPRRK